MLNKMKRKRIFYCSIYFILFYFIAHETTALRKNYSARRHQSRYGTLHVCRKTSVFKKYNRITSVAFFQIKLPERFEPVGKVYAYQ